MVFVMCSHSMSMKMGYVRTYVFVVDVRSYGADGQESSNFMTYGIHVIREFLKDIK